MKVIEDISRKLELLIRIVISIMVPSMTIIVFMQVVMRYVFKSSFMWAEEAGRYLLVWICCLGSAYAVKSGEHISVTFFSKQLKKILNYKSNVLVYAIVEVFFLVCSYYGFFLSISEWKQYSPSLQIRMTWVLFSIPFSFALMAFFTLECISKELSNGKSG